MQTKACIYTYRGLNNINGIGKHVKNTVSRRKNFRPHKSDRPPINGALRKDKNP